MPVDTDPTDRMIRDTDVMSSLIVFGLIVGGWIWWRRQNGSKGEASIHIRIRLE